MQDKVGISFALNRIAISLYFQKKYDLSLKFNNKCLEMIDDENLYSVLYNVGIVHRKLNQFEESLAIFSQALSWSHTRRDKESESLILG
jgi:tetratricopeptide (TPR) repeat protein